MRAAPHLLGTDMRIVITGGAGFLGSHLSETLLEAGHEVVVFDNFVTGRKSNVSHLLPNPKFTLHEHDVIKPFEVDAHVDGVLHFASPASPVDYLEKPIETLLVGSDGTRNALDLAERHGARFVIASTSEVYGDPLVHPQTEEYWGNVNPVGPRSVYDEAKRYAEALTMAYRTSRGVNTGIVRIFNTFGPRMRPDDGRAIPNFVRQALAGESVTVAGDGSQTRSICYVDDLVNAIVRMLLTTQDAGPINIGNPYEISMLDLARWIVDLTDSSSTITLIERPTDDPNVRKPDITRAQHVLGWSPKVGPQEGLARTIEYFRAIL